MLEISKLLSHKNISRLKWWGYLSVFVPIMLAVFAGEQIPQMLSVSMTDSVGHWVFLVFPQPVYDVRKIKNKYIAFMVEHPGLQKGKKMRVIKKAICVSEDYLVVKDKDYWCNSTYIGKAKDYTLTGDKLDAFIYNGKIPEDKIFAFGQHKDSYDSRYFGFIDKKDIEYKAFPVL